MSKIGDFENIIVAKGMTDDDFIEYGKLLRRVNGNYNKIQHCYTTAIKFPKNNYTQAIKLIEYGLDNFADTWSSKYTSYLYMGHIYENAGKYSEAYDSFLSAKNSIPVEHKTYLIEISSELLWMKLHIDSFHYSTELEEYYDCYSQADEFSKSFLNKQYRMAIANLVISLHYSNYAQAKSALNEAEKISKKGYVGPLYKLLEYHRYYETLRHTPESLNFIKKTKIKLLFYK